jgi:hypothetical protein
MYLFYLNHGDPHNNPFDAGKSKWLFLSLLTWNMLGSWRFISDFGTIAGRMAGIILWFTFPLFYLYNIWYILIKKDKREDR